MKIVIFGANGRVGQLTVKEALAHGYDVRAFIHGSNPFQKQEKLEVIQGDIYNAVDIENALEDVELIVSALGSWGTAKKNVLSAAMSLIIPAVKVSTCHRIISLTGADAEALGDKKNIVHRIMRAILHINARRILEDGEKHIQLLEESGLDWSVLRSPIMNNKGNSDIYVVTSRRPYPWQTINRASVAKALISLIGDTTEFKKAPYITRK